MGVQPERRRINEQLRQLMKTKIIISAVSLALLVFGAKVTDFIFAMTDGRRIFELSMLYYFIAYSSSIFLFEISERTRGYQVHNFWKLITTRFKIVSIVFILFIVYLIIFRFFDKENFLQLLAVTFFSQLAIMTISSTIACIIISCFWRPSKV